MRRLFAVSAAAVAVLALAACGEKKESLTAAKGSSQSITLMLDWFPNADHVGIYQALAEGGFSRAGLDVHVQTPSDPASPLQLLAAGKVDLAISYEPEVMLARSRGEPVVAVGAIVQQPLTSIVSIGSKHIRTPSDLRGKTVGDAGIAYQHAYLMTILARAHVPLNSVREVNVGANLVPAMLSGRVDATLGAYWNVEAVQLQQMGKNPNVIRMNQVGVPTYNELVVVARQNELTGGRIAVIRRFVQALGRGYASVRSNPTGAVANLVKANPTLDRKLQLASVRSTLSAFFPSGVDAGRPWGWQDPTQWTAYGQWMLSNHLVSAPTAFDGASTNEVLPGQGS